METLTTTYEEFKRMTSTTNQTKIKAIIAKLTQQANDVLREQGDYPSIEIRLNGRIRTALGQFVRGSRRGQAYMYIDISKRQAILDYNFGTDLCLDILKHELCHYMVYMDKGHCGDGEADFEKRLAIVGASSSGVTPERLKVSKVKQHYYIIHDIYHVYKKDNSFINVFKI